MAGDEAGVPENGPIDLSRLNTGVPHPARVYDVWLGGKDNFAADRAAAEAGLQAFPSTIKSVRANRAFLARTVRYLVQEQGLRQLLDIGTGLPSANNTHEVAQAVAPDTRVVYVDNDPIVLAHARALLTSTAGPTAFIDTDLRDAAAILAGAAQTLDFSQPVAPMRRRTRDEVARFFGGLDLVEPGIVQMHQWRPTGQETAAPSSGYAAVARKP